MSDATVQLLVDAAFSVLAHDMSRNSLGDAKDAYQNQSAAMRNLFRKILKKGGTMSTFEWDEAGRPIEARINRRGCKGSLPADAAKAIGEAARKLAAHARQQAPPTFAEVIDLSKLKTADKQKLLALMRLLAMRAIEMTGTELRDARVAAGLSVGQAVHLIGRITRDELCVAEAMGLAGTSLEKMAGEFDRAYGLGVEELQ